MTEIETVALGPIAPRERIAALDVLRGLAIAGIFVVNMQFFAMPLVDLLVPAPPEGPLSHQASWWVLKVGFEYKFVSLFSLLFGMGLVVQLRRAEARGRPFVPMYLRRTFVLMGIGLFHALGIWYGDILFVYSWVALLMIAMRNVRAKILVVLAIATIGFSAGFVGCFGAAGVLYQTYRTPAAAQEQAEPAEQLEAEAAETEPDQIEPLPAGAPVWDRVRHAFKRVTGGNSEAESQDAWREIETIAYKEGPLSVTLVVRAVTFVIILFMIGLGGFLFRVIGMFMLGMALMKLDFFSPGRRRWHVLMAAAGLPLGLAGEILAALMLSSGGEQLTWARAMADPVHQITSLMLCFGYVGAVTLAVSSGLLPRLAAAVACVGRMALSNYLLQSVTATGLMYWYGLGWFGEVTRPVQLGLVAAIFVSQIIVSVIWLHYFRFGPVEWLWRSLTYAKRQPMVARRA